MHIKKYYSLDRNKVKQKKLAQLLGVSESQMSQMVSGSTNISNKRCVLIEDFTNGEVSRKDLHPNDWQEIWPELVNKDKNAA